MPAHVVRSALALVTLPWLAACGPDRVADTEVEVREGVTFELGAEVPFSGVVWSAFPDSVADVTTEEPRIETAYLDGLRHGERVERHPNGSLRRRQTFVNDSTQGVLREWTPAGTLILEQEVVGGRAEGPSRTWYPDGSLESEATYLNGALDGVLTRWWPNGEKRLERTYRAGHPHGPAREWYDDGRPLLEGSYANGRLQGPYRKWHPDGKLAIEAEYHRGASIELRMWDEAGTPVPIEPDLAVSDTIR